jgi:hypothetical protein
MTDVFSKRVAKDFTQPAKNPSTGSALSIFCVIKSILVIEAII